MLLLNCPKSLAVEQACQTMAVAVEEFSVVRVIKLDAAFPTFVCSVALPQTRRIIGRLLLKIRRFTLKTSEECWLCAYVYNFLKNGAALLTDLPELP